MLKARNKLNKFVIYHEARTGSTMLQIALNSHPDIFCGPEIFHHTLAFNKYSIFKSAKDYLNEIIDVRNEKVAGFKLQHYQAKPDMSGIGHDASHELIDVRDELVDQGYKIIRPIRRNKLEQYISLTVAFKTGRWHVFPVGKYTSIPNVKIYFDSNEFKNWYYNVVKDTDNDLNDTSLNQLERLDVFYEDMVDNWSDTSKKLTDFLDVEHIDLKPITNKVRYGSLSDWIENYEEAIDFYNNFIEE